MCGWALVGGCASVVLWARLGSWTRVCSWARVILWARLSSVWLGSCGWVGSCVFGVCLVVGRVWFDPGAWVCSRVGGCAGSCVYVCEFLWVGGLVWVHRCVVVRARLVCRLVFVSVSGLVWAGYVSGLARAR